MSVEAGPGSGTSLFLRAYLASMALATVAGLVGGYLAGPGLVLEFLKEKSFIVEAIRANPLLGVGAIFANNLLSSLIAMIPVLGLIVLGVNMAVIGSLASAAPQALVFLVPHGVFELPAIYYSVYLGGRVVADARRKGAGKAFSSMLASWAKIVIPLLLIAAFVEVFVSTALASMMLGKGP